VDTITSEIQIHAEQRDGIVGIARSERIHAEIMASASASAMLRTLGSAIADMEEALASLRRFVEDTEKSPQDIVTNEALRWVVWDLRNRAISLDHKLTSTGTELAVRDAIVSRMSGILERAGIDPTTGKARQS